MATETGLPDESPWLSIVIPAKNESGNIEMLVEGIVAACAAYTPYEIIYIDDGSTDDTADKVREMAAKYPFVRLVQHSESGGQSAAVHSGVLAARGSVIGTLDADGQNPPSELPNLIAKIDGAPFRRVSPLSPASASAARIPPPSGGPPRPPMPCAAGSSRTTPATPDAASSFSVATPFSPFPISTTCTATCPHLPRATGGKCCTQMCPMRHAMPEGRNIPTSVAPLVGIYDLVGVVWLLKRRKRVRGVEVGET